MKRDYIFLGETGITDTTANRVADFAKLAYTDGETMLSSMSFVNEKIETIDGEKSKDLAFGMTSLSDVEVTIERIGTLKSLCAWLREAVKAHQRLLDELSAYSFDDYIKDNGIQLPDRPSCNETITEDDVIASFDVKKRNRYYFLETMASTIGLVIHKGGPFDAARKEYYDRLSHPRSTTGSGTETLIYSYEPSVEKGEIENVFYTLQQKHSAYQKELNSIKSEIVSKITNDDIEKKAKYQDEYESYTKTRNIEFNKYNTWKVEEQKRIASLKIVIPNALKDIYDKVASTGKEK